jgi:hypothetical protein
MVGGIASAVMRRLLSIRVPMPSIGRFGMACAGSVGIAGGINMVRPRMASAAAATPSTSASTSSTLPFATPIVGNYTVTGQGVAPGFVGAIGNTPLIELKTYNTSTISHHIRSK